MKLWALAEAIQPQLHFLYHGTVGSNVEQILREGLKARGVNRLWRNTDTMYFNNLDGVHLTEEIDAAHRWVLRGLRKFPEAMEAIRDWEQKTDSSYRAITVLKVDVSGLDMKLMEKDNVGTMGDWKYNGDIPPGLVSLV